MDKHTLELLEFEKITDELSSYCFSEEGAEKIVKGRFYREEEELRSRLDLVDDFEQILAKKTDAPDVWCPAVKEAISKAAKEGTVLSEAEFSSLRQLLTSGRKLRELITKPDSRGEMVIPSSSEIVKIAEELPRLKFLEKAVNDVITPEGEVDENIPSLKSIRKNILKLHGDIRSVADSYLREPRYRNCFQEQTAGQKDGRTVLPVKAQYKQKINGLVQDISSSGATLFMEPYELVEKNNELSIENGKYRQEVDRILTELTKTFREHCADLETMRLTIVEIDCIYAAARYGRIHGCSRIEVTSDEIELIEARHPLLGNSAVPVNFIAPPTVRTVVISGPNTGGKTVGLKTVGLLSVMHQYGMKLPVREGSRLPIFSNVFADIGDEQSIDLSLSTFSGHMRRISDVCRKADNRALVLLDELGSGTDAVEGGALAMAVLDYLAKTGCTTVVTTHQSSLKNYAFGEKTAENASVEFDLSKLKPTFRILPGIPGESHALEIAEMMGMEPVIMEQARNYCEKGLSDVNTIIREITAKQQDLRRRESELEKIEAEFSAKTDALRSREKEVREKLKSLQREDIRELQLFTKETRKRLENMVRELREGEINREKTKEIKEFIGELEYKIEDEQRNIQELEENREEATREEEMDFSGTLRPGTEVLLRENRKKGTLIRKGKGDSWIVSVGNIKIQAEEKDLRPLREKNYQKEQPRVDYSAEKVTIPLELDIRGMRFEEAQRELRKYIDNAVLQGKDLVEIIHGKGEGILQEAVGKALRELPVVEDFTFASPETGGFGKTVVRLRKSN